MTTEIRLQDPGADGGYLLEDLLAASTEATRGGAIYAWANIGGVKSLLWDESFRDFLTRGPFDLVVGLDSITDENAITALMQATAECQNLTVRAFLNDTSALFHSKIAWFETPDALTLL